MDISNSSENFNSEHMLNQITQLYEIIEWVKQYVNNEIRIIKFNNGIDTDIYTIERLTAKKDKLLATMPAKTASNVMLELADLKLNVEKLSSEMQPLRATAFSKTALTEARIECSNKLEDLNTKYNEYNKKYNEQVNMLNPEIKTKLPGIYGSIMDGADINTIKHVFNTFENMKKGKISVNQAVNVGLDFEEARGAPKGLFDFVLDGPRVKNGTKIKKAKRGDIK